MIIKTLKLTFPDVEWMNECRHNREQTAHTHTASWLKLRDDFNHVDDGY